MNQDKYSLRERKHAKTKLSLMHAFIERLKTQRFEEINISRFCADMDVSEGTFFNYFPCKIDLIHYFIALTSTHVVWKTYHQSDQRYYLNLIDNVFDNFAEEINDPNLIYEILSAVIGQKQVPQMLKVTQAEKYFAFPACEGIENIPTPAILFEDFFNEVLGKAAKNRELPGTTNIHDAVLFLKTLMTGLPLAFKTKDFKSLKSDQKKILRIFWKALGRKDYRGNQ
ncbi:MAG: TetR/AcrR family transcriptional regulator [bacterium]|nr:TetR/AcrR family transcriptional regulator [bacterium]